MGDKTEATVKKSEIIEQLERYASDNNWLLLSKDIGHNLRAFPSILYITPQGNTVLIQAYSNGLTLNQIVVEEW